MLISIDLCNNYKEALSNHQHKFIIFIEHKIKETWQQHVLHVKFVLKVLFLTIILIDKDNLSKGVCINQLGTCPKSLDSFMLTQKRQTFRSSNLGSYGD
jgi:hypothetical protein